MAGDLPPRYTRIKLMHKKPIKYDPIVISTIIIAVAAVLNLIASLVISFKTSEYTEVTKNIYNSANRPYVGVESIDVDDSDKKHLIFNIKLKNYGTVPATDVRIEDNIIIDGIKTKKGGYEIYDAHTNIYPQATRKTWLKIGFDYENIVNGHKVLDLSIAIKYKGISDNKDEYNNYEVFRYDNVRKAIQPIEANVK